MAKKEYTLQDAVDRFLDQVVTKAKYTKFIRDNKILYGKNKKNKPMFIMIEQTLWNALPDTFKANIREFDLSLAEDRYIQSKVKFFNERFSDEGWIEIDGTKFQNNEMITFDLPKGFDYKLEINYGIWPLRFKKDDCNNFSYKLKIEKESWFMIRKYYEGLIPDTGFTIIRMMRLI